MYYGQIITTDTANGEGIRLSLFVSGCTNHCKDCFQPQTWDFCYGKPYTMDVEAFIIKELSKTYYDGLTILGGEPMELENQPEINNLITHVKMVQPAKSIWIYTGFIYEKDLVEGGRRFIPDVTPNILSNTKVLVDGPFMIDKKNLMLKFRGSENQRLLDMQKTLEQRTPVLYEP